MGLTPDIGIRVVVLGVAEAHRQIGAFRNDLTRTAVDIDRVKSSISTFGRDMVRTGDAMVSVGRTLTFSLTAPVLGLGTALVASGVNFEQAFAGVSKTVEGVSDNFGNLTGVGQQLRQSFIDMSLEIPIASTELARVGQVAGQLGIPANQIEGFTETISKMGTATDLSSDEAAFAIARLGNIMGVSADNMSQFAEQAANAIVDLGNKVAATEPEITKLSLRIAGAGRAIGLTTPEVLGISAALAEAGVNAELGGSAISRILLEMKNSVNEYTDSSVDMINSQNEVNGELNTLQGLLESGEVDFYKIQDALKGSVLDLDALKEELQNVNTEFISIEEVIQRVESRSMARLNQQLASNRAEHIELEQRTEDTKNQIQKFRSELIKGNTDIDQLNLAFAGTDLVLSGISSDLQDLTSDVTSVDDIIDKVQSQTLARFNEQFARTAGEQKEFSRRTQDLNQGLGQAREYFLGGGTDLDQLRLALAGTGVVLSGITGDLQDFSEGTLSIDDLLKKIRARSFLDLAEDMADSQNESEDLTHRFSEMDTQLANLRKSILSGVTDFDDLKAQFSGTDLVLSGLTSELNDLTKETVSVDDIVNKVEARSMTNLKERMVENEKEGQKLEDRISNMRVELEKLQAEIQSGNTDIDKLNELFAGTDLVLSGLGSELEKTEKGFLDIGSVINKVREESLRGLNEDTTEGAKQLEEFARVSGLSAEEMKQMIENNPSKALELFLAGTARLNSEGGLTNDVLSELGLNTIRLKDVMNRLGPNVNLLSRDIGIANEQWEKQNALQIEFEKQSRTIRNRLQLLKNSFSALGVEIFDLVRDDLIYLIDKVREGIQYFIDMDDKTKKLIIRIGLLAASVGPALLIFGTFLQIAGNATLGLGNLLGVFKGFIGLPLGSLVSIFSLIFGGKAVSPKVTKQATSKGLIGSLFGLNISSLTKPIRSLQEGIIGLFTFPANLASKAATNLGKTFLQIFDNLNIGNIARLFVGNLADGISTVFSTAGNVASSIGSGVFGVIKGVFASLFGPLSVFVDSALSGVFGVVKSILGPIAGLFKDTFTGIAGLIGKAGGALFSFAGKLPGFAGSLVKFILGPLKAIPSIIGLAVGAFTVLFAPKVITQFAKNWKDVLGQVQTSFSQFVDDVKNKGLEEAVLLFFGGGSTGSGREGGIYGIAKALGAGEDAARKFSYALGTASYWVIQIVNSTVDLVKQIIAGNKETDKLGQKTKSTSDRLIDLAANIAKFFEGFFVGWTSSFDDIVSASGVLGDALSHLISSVGSLFDEIFGRGEETVGGFYDTLEIGADSAAMKTGASVGQIVGDLVSLVIRGLAFITEISAVVIDAFADIVAAYKAGGLKGVFEEIKPIFSDLFAGFILAAETLWEVVKPKLITFKDSAVEWVTKEGVPAIGEAFKGITSIFGAILFGFESSKTEITSQLVDEAGNIVGEIDRKLTPLEKSKNYGLGLRTIELEKSVGFEGLLSITRKAIQSVIDYVTGEGKDDVIAVFKSLVKGAGDVFSFLWEGNSDFEGIKSILNTLVSNIETWITDTAFPKFKEIGKEMIRGIATGVAEGLIKETNAYGIAFTVLGFFKDPIATLKGDDPYKDSKTEGEKVGTGYTDGIIIGLTRERNMNIAMGKITEILNQPFFDFGISSPSTVMWQFGYDYTQGIIDGINYRAPGVAVEINNIGNMFFGLVPQIANALSLSRGEIDRFLSYTNSSFSTISSTISGAIGNAFSFISGRASTNVTNTNTYSPTFYGPQPQQTINQNNDLYSRWLYNR